MSANSPAAMPASVPFRDLALAEPVLKALVDLGYESATPIQAATIPHLLEGRDVVGQAQTGTGKTAAFALPILSKIELRGTAPQALVLAPTRELAIQVAEAFQSYAGQLPGFHVLPIYGGQSYEPQLRSLRRGVHVVVGTPGRVMDHIKKGTLKLDQLKCLVLDEADEMLRMGFIDDVEWILEQTPPTRQVALFSATMPAPIRKIAQKHLKSPTEISIKAKTTTANNIRQRYWKVSGLHKLDALTRILEAETFDGMLVFTRTKIATVEVADRLAARGFAVAPLSGDVEQRQRERTIAQLKDGTIDIVVATDVAARGLDVDRISHVINYDIPSDTESYVHRIGRTGRAGRSGDAILFVSPRERNMLMAIERATRQPIEPMDLPSVESVNERRMARFKEKITGALQVEGLDVFRSMIEQYEQDNDVPAVEIAAALAKALQGDAPLLLDSKQREFSPPARESGAREGSRVRDREFDSDDRPARKPKPPRAGPEAGMETFRIEVGHIHGVMPANIVGAIANEAELESKYIGRIDIHDDHTLVDLPEGMPKQLLNHMQKVWVAGQQMQMKRLNEVVEADATGGKPGYRPDHKPAHRPDRRPDHRAARPSPAPRLTHKADDRPRHKIGLRDGHAPVTRSTTGNVEMQGPKGGVVHVKKREPRPPSPNTGPARHGHSKKRPPR